MAHRLVVALTTLLGLTAATVVGSYLFLFAGTADRAASFAPPDSVAYLNVYLEPSAGQQMNLGALLGHVAGFGDEAALETKIDEIAQRLLGQVGVDYRRDLRPWIGGQVALAIGAPADATSAPTFLVIAAVNDAAQAEAALDRLAARDGTGGTTEAYAGASLHIAADGGTAAIVDGVALFAPDRDGVRAAIDRHMGGGALAGASAFTSAMAGLPADHLASLYLDLERAASVAGIDVPLSVASFALLAEPDAVRLRGAVPLPTTSGDAAGAPSLGPATIDGLAEWLPADTQVSATVSRLGEMVGALERAASSIPEAAQALTQLRALAVLGLGIDIERDVVPLLGGGTAIGVHDLAGTPHGVLVLAPPDPAAAAATLDHVADALESRGLERDGQVIGGVEVTTLSVPDVGSVAYAAVDEVLLLALGADEIGLAIDARASGRTLAADPGYRAAFGLVGEPGANRLYVDLASLIGSFDGLAGLDADTRAILDPIRRLAINAPIDADRLEINAVVTVE